MARLYRETETKANFTIASGVSGEDVFFISPIQVANANGYVKSVKVTVHPSLNAGESYLVVASTDLTPSTNNNWITAAHTPVGGGTVWLSLKRSIKQTTEDPQRGDGRIFIHVFCQTPGAQHTAVCEAWGRFIQVVPS